jgi:hypothetical protein
MSRVSDIRNYVPSAYAADPDIPTLQWWRLCTTVASCSFWLLIELIKITLVTSLPSLLWHTIMARDILAIPGVSAAVEQ